MRASFARQVYAVVKRIPRGKVAMYGQVAWLAGRPGAGRAVGNILHKNPYHDVPCHRVVNFQGRLAPHFGRGGAQKQRQLLLAEGIKFQGQNVDLADSRCDILKEDA